jgi:cytochrome c-type biogenesis protein CcmH/NrfG
VELGETPTGLTHLGLAYLAVGDARAARQAFGRAKRRAPKATRPGSGGLEAKMLEQIRRNLQLTEKLANRKRSRVR